MPYGTNWYKICQIHGKMLSESKISYFDIVTRFYRNATSSNGQYMRDSLSFIGQEQDGTLLFHWYDKSPGREDNLVSFIGAYNPHKQAIKTVFISDCKTLIVNASINREHTFLAFTTSEESETTGPQGRRIKRNVYKAYIAEIHPQNRVFYLNLERHNFVKVQFLYGKFRSPIVLSVSRLLVFLHKESVGLYCIPVARVGRDGCILGGEPRKEPLFHRRPAWIQFDAAHQRLYVIYHKKPTSGRDESAPISSSEPGSNGAKTGSSSQGHAHRQTCLCVLHFNESIEAASVLSITQTVMDIPINLPVPYTKASTLSNYIYLGPYHSIPDSSLNIEVLTNSSGAMCVCFQQMNNHFKGDSALNYSVFVVHKERTLSVQCPSVPPETLRTARVSFFWIDGYLVAYLPGCFTHLLNVNTEFDIALHIVYRDAAIQQSPRSHLVQFVGDKQLHSASVVSLFDVGLSSAVRLQVNRSSLVQLFSSCGSLTTGAAIMHFAVVQHSDFQLIKQLMTSLCVDFSSNDVTNLLQEFLTGHLYALLAPRVEKSLHRYLPYSAFVSNSTNRGQLYCDNMELVCCTSISGVSDTVRLEETPVVQEDSFWQALAGHVEAGHFAVNCHFNMREAGLRRGGGNLGSVGAVSEPLNQLFYQQDCSSDSLVEERREQSSISGSTPPQRPTSRVEVVFGKPPGFLKHDEGQAQNMRYHSKTLEQFASHFLSFLANESRTKVRNIGEELARCQLQVCRLLCHIIWAVLGSPETEEALLTTCSTPKERDLFSVYEQVYLATEALTFTLPSGFNDFFMQLGYRCQGNSVTFMQYLSRGIYRPSRDCVLKFLKQLPDDVQTWTVSAISEGQINIEENKKRDQSAVSGFLDLKWRLIHQLPKEEGLICLKEWGHPSALQYLSESRAMHAYNSKPQGSSAGTTPQKGEPALRTHKPRYPRQLTTGASGQTESALFTPLQALIKYLQNREGSSPTDVDSFASLEKEIIQSARESIFSSSI